MKKALSLILCVVLLISLLAACGKEETFIWADVVMEDILPEPPSNKGKFITNTIESLWMDVNDLTDKQFAEYVEACKEKGFTVDADSSGLSYNAYNTDGYNLSLFFAGSTKTLNIHLDAPMEMTEIKWPESEAGKQLPAPESTKGKFVSEKDTSFNVYIGDTSKEAYEAYIEACADEGFNVDSSKTEKNYSAKNADGWKVSVRYEGFDIIQITISAPSAETTPTEAPAETKPATNDKMDSDFKAAMDAYEEFIDEYVDIVKKYTKNPTDLTILASYGEYMGKYATMVAEFEKWENEELNAAETAYYVQVQGRVTKKLLEVAQ